MTNGNAIYKKIALFSIFSSMVISLENSLVFVRRAEELALCSLKSRPRKVENHVRCRMIGKVRRKATKQTFFISFQSIAYRVVNPCCGGKFTSSNENGPRLEESFLIRMVVYGQMGSILVDSESNV